MGWPHRLLLCALASATACGRTSVDARFGPGEGGADDADPLAQLPEGEDAGGSSQPCEEVDFLFVIDNSGSMADNQAKLAENYDVFVHGIQDAVDRLESIHVGVVTTDAYARNLSACSELGGLVVQTGGADASGKLCGPYQEGDNFMTEADDLDEAFRCAAQVGTSGSGLEAPLGATLAAINAPLTDRGGCNEGFLRPDALLVLVIVTDEDVEMDPVFAAAELLIAKNGGLDDFVVVALGNPTDGECGFGDAGAYSYGLESFVSSFRHGFFGPICALDYSEVLEAAVEVVQDACPGRG